MGFRLALGDITKMQTDAIVNASNPSLKETPGICRAIFQAADTEALTRACEKIGKCRPGRAVITNSYGLPAKYIIHVAGHGWYGGSKNEKIELGLCYKRALDLALAYDCRSVAFPLIFSGEYHIPRKEALLAAGTAIQDFLQFCEMDVVLVLYNQAIYDYACQVLKKILKRNRKESVF